MVNNDERKKILEVHKKYHGFFEKMNADIAFGVNGPNFFYVLDDDNEYFEVFNTFEKAEELEAMIIAELTSEVDFYTSLNAESTLQAFNEDTINESFNQGSPETSLNNLIQRMKALAEQNAKWYEFLSKTYYSLTNISEIPTDVL